AKTSVKRSAGTGTGWPLFPFSGATTKEGQKINGHTAFKISGFWCAVNTIANSVALLPKSVFQEIGDNKDRDMDHAVDYLVHSEPNSYMTAFTFWFIMTVAMLVKGNAYAYIVRSNSGEVIQLRFMHPEDVGIIERENQLFYKYKGATFFSWEVLHIPLFSFNGVNGRSVIQYAADNLGVSLAANEFAANAYNDRGVAYGVLESDKVINNVGSKNLQSHFNNAMNNNSKYKLAVFDEGLKYKRISLAPNEAQFIEAQVNGVEDLARWFQIPLHKLHAKGEGGYNFLVQMSIEYLQTAVMPIGQRIKQECERKLFTTAERKAGYFIFNNYKKLLEADPAARGQYYKDMVYIKAMNPNEVRRLEGYNPYKGGDEFLQMTNLLTQEQIQKDLKDGKAA
ncbi:MAG: phage portal protein, partial [Bacteroidota bacterium]